MLRLFVVLLVLINAAYFAWTKGWAAAWGYAPVEQSEPHRLTEQLMPEKIQIQRSFVKSSASKASANTSYASTSPAATAIASVSAAASTSSVATACLQTPLLAAEQAAAIRTALASTPGARWRLAPETQAGRWMIYMGKYPDTEMVQRKQGELRRLQVSFQTLTSPTWGPGLSLGTFDSQEAASAAISLLGTKGVRTARVVQERAPIQGQRLTLPLGDAGLQDLLRPILLSKPLGAC